MNPIITGRIRAHARVKNILAEQPHRPLPPLLPIPKWRRDPIPDMLFFRPWFDGENKCGAPIYHAFPREKFLPTELRPAETFFGKSKTTYAALKLCSFCWQQAMYTDPRTGQRFCSLQCGVRIRVARDPQNVEAGYGEKEKNFNLYRKHCTGFE